MENSEPYRALGLNVLIYRTESSQNKNKILVDKQYKTL